MPHYRIHIATSDGSLDSRDREGITLEEIGALRAHVTETLIEAARARPTLGAKRVITVTAEDERGGQAYRDCVTIRGCPAPSAEDRALWRAMAAMDQAT